MALAQQLQINPKPERKLDMLHITVALPDDVAQEYYNASQQLADYLGGEPRPSPQR
jgi:hypothetical protein